MSTLAVVAAMLAVVLPAVVGAVWLRREADRAWAEHQLRVRRAERLARIGRAASSAVVVFTDAGTAAVRAAAEFERVAEMIRVAGGGDPDVDRLREALARAGRSVHEVNSLNVGDLIGRDLGRNL